VNARRIRDDLEEQGSIFLTTTDSEIVLHLIAKSVKHGLEHAMLETLKQVKGAYSMVIYDPGYSHCHERSSWVQALCLGRLGSGYVITSETCALDLVEAEYVREVKPGEILIINQNGIRSVQSELSERKAQCIFELIYFSRPDSVVFGQNVYLFRKKQGSFSPRNSLSMLTS